MIRFSAMRRHWAFRLWSGLMSIVFLSYSSFFLVGLTSGPTVSEVKGFSARGERRHVDLFSGDFVYEVPLFDIGGYPLRLFYRSSVRMEDEASWVGLGWQLNVGQVRRTVVGLPDDLKGELIEEAQSQRPSENVVLGFNALDLEFFSGELSKVGFAFYFSNYYGFSVGYNASIAKMPIGEQATAGLSIESGAGGLRLTPNISLDLMRKREKEKAERGWALGAKLASLIGVQSINYDFNYVLGITSGASAALYSSPPVSSFPRRSIGIGVGLKTGITFLGADLDVAIRVQKTMEWLSQRTRRTPAYGMLYHWGKTGEEGVYVDYVKEKDGSYVEGTPFLPQTYLGADLYRVDAWGLSGTYRAAHYYPKRIDRMRQSSVEGGDIDLGLELGGGNATDISGNVVLNLQGQHTRGWRGVGYEEPKLYEERFGFPGVYFYAIESGLPHVSEEVYNKLGGDKAIRFELREQAPFIYRAEGVISSSHQSLPWWSEAKFKGYPGYGSEVFHPLRQDILERIEHVGRYAKLRSWGKHRLAGIKLRKGGRTYYFGLAAVNTRQSSVQFNVGRKGKNLVDYNSQESSLYNQSGLTHYYYRRDIPPYAYAYLLTDIYSEDYRDRLGDGPTPDDYGSYVVFDYERVSSNYRWRVPYVSQPGKASYVEGLYSLDNDDKATYVYGEKELWYLRSIRTKDRIALFYTSPRLDGYEAKGETGGIGNQSLHKLDSIVVYDLATYVQQGDSGEALLRVYFKYDYSLCPGVYNNKFGGGKLTLKEVRICRENGESCEVWRFGYSDFNPPYNPRNVDGWGMYQDKEGLLGSGNQVEEYPFTFQRSGNDLWASAWLLTEIEEPWGGRIRVYYERDRYGWVQDRRAMRMFRLLGAGEHLNDTTFSHGWDESVGLYGLYKEQHPYLFFDSGISSSVPLQEAQKRLQSYFSVLDRQRCYFRARVQMYPGDPPDKYEEVYGFLSWEDYGLLSTSFQGHYVGWLKVRLVKLPKKQVWVHPFTYSALNLGLAEARNVIERDYYIAPGQLEDFIGFAKWFVNNNPLGQLVNNAMRLIDGPFKYYFNKGVGYRFLPWRSYVRLGCGSYKYGGGSRVRRIVYEDRWDAMSGERLQRLEKRYVYAYDTSGIECSGVAQWEPVGIGEENPFHDLLPYSAQGLWGRFLAPPSPKYFYVLPIGESQFGSPGVGYACVYELRVVEGDLPSDGYVKYTFYTARDYPSRWESTDLQSLKPRMQAPLVFFLQRPAVVHVATSQGFYVETNNMHGKPKSEEHYDGLGRLLRRVETFYRSGMQPYFESDNKVRYRYSGVSCDVVLWTEEEVLKQMGLTVSPNLNTFVIPLLFVMLPIPFGMLWLNASYSEQVYRSVVVTKVVHKNYVAYRQEIEERGSRLDVEYLALDPYGGEALIRKEIGKRGEKRYRYRLPAHYVYKNMSSGLINEGLTVVLSTDNEGRIQPSLYVDRLCHGDVLIDGNGDSAWVFVSGQEKYLLNRLGDSIITQQHVYYVLHSGNDHWLDAVAEEVVLLDNPIQGNGTVDLNAGVRVIDARSWRYTDFYSYPYGGCIYDCDEQLIEADDVEATPLKQKIDTQVWDTLVIDYGLYEDTMKGIGYAGRVHFFPIDSGVIHVTSDLGKGNVQVNCGLIDWRGQWVWRYRFPLEGNYNKVIVAPYDDTTFVMAWGIEEGAERAIHLLRFHSNTGKLLARREVQLLQFLPTINVNDMLVDNGRIWIIGLAKDGNRLLPLLLEIHWTGCWGMFYLGEKAGYFTKGVISDSSLWIVGYGISTEKSRILQLLRFDINKGKVEEAVRFPVIKEGEIQIAYDSIRDELHLFRSVGDRVLIHERFRGHGLQPLGRSYWDLGGLGANVLASWGGVWVQDGKMQGVIIASVGKTHPYALLFKAMVGQPPWMVKSAPMQTGLTGIVVDSLYFVDGFNGKGRYVVYVSDSLPLLCSEPINISYFTTSLSVLPLEVSLKQDVFKCDPIGLFSPQPIPLLVPSVCAPLYVRLRGAYRCYCDGWIEVDSITPGYWYVWSDGSVSPRIEGLCPGVYRLDIYNGSGNLVLSYKVPLFQGGGLVKWKQFHLNPFVYNLSSSWRLFEEYGYHARRYPLELDTLLGIEGYYAVFHPFYRYVGGRWEEQKDGYRLLRQIVHYDVYGNVLEERDVLDLYRSTSYVYGGLREAFLAQDARSHEVGYDGFEDYYPELPSYSGGAFSLGHRHFRLDSLYEASIDGEVYHGGSHSLRIAPQGLALYRGALRAYVDQRRFRPHVVYPFVITPYHCNDVFSPYARKQKYLLSFWFYERGADVDWISGAAPKVWSPEIKDLELRFEIGGEEQDIHLYYRSPLIDGWRLYHYLVEIEGKPCDPWQLVFRNKGKKPIPLYIDDVRLIPFRSLVSSFTYYPFRGLLSGRLDANHVLEGYIYDRDYRVESVYRDSERGRVYMYYRRRRIKRDTP